MSKLIIGCGYLGRRVGRGGWRPGMKWPGVVRHASQQQQITQDGIRPIVADVTRPDTLDRLPSAETVLVCVGYDEAGGKSRWEVYADGLQAVLDALGPFTRRVIFISSTGVYGEAGGGMGRRRFRLPPRPGVDQGTVGGRASAGRPPLGRFGIVLRLAGLYGTGPTPTDCGPLVRPTV